MPLYYYYFKILITASLSTSQRFYVTVKFGGQLTRAQSLQKCLNPRAAIPLFLSKSLINTPTRTQTDSQTHLNTPTKTASLIGFLIIKLN